MCSLFTKALFRDTKHRGKQKSDETADSHWTEELAELSWFAERQFTAFKAHTLLRLAGSLAG